MFELDELRKVLEAKINNIRKTLEKKIRWYHETFVLWDGCFFIRKGCLYERV